MSASELRPDDRAPNLWLSGEVVIGDVQIGANVVIEGPARIGDGVVIEHGALIGKRPTLAPHSSASASDGDSEKDPNHDNHRQTTTQCFIRDVPS